MVVAKVKAHLTVDGLVGPDSITSMRGNFMVDTLAGLGASRHAACPDEVQLVRHTDALASALLQRFAAITLHCAKGWPDERVPARLKAPPRAPLRELVAASPHCLERVGAAAWRCKRCLRRAPRKGLRLWLQQEKECRRESKALTLDTARASECDKPKLQRALSWLLVWPCIRHIQSLARRDIGGASSVVASRGWPRRHPGP